MSAGPGVLVRLVDRLTNRDGRHEAPIRFDGAEPVLDEAAQRAKASAFITQLVGLAAGVGLVAETDVSVWVGVLVALAAGLIAVANAVLTVRRAYQVRAQVTPLQTVPGEVIVHVDPDVLTQVDPGDAPSP